MTRTFEIWFLNNFEVYNTVCNTVLLQSQCCGRSRILIDKGSSEKVEDMAF